MNLPRALRQIRHLRPAQAFAQLRHTLGSGVRPIEWRSAAPALRVAQSKTAFLPAPPHAHFDGFRRIELVNRAVAFRDEIDWDFEGEGMLWAYQLHEFHYARRPGVSPAARAALMLDWVERHRRGVGFDPHPMCLRILSWGKLLLTPGALALDDAARERVLVSLAGQVETLSRHLEVRLQANHLLSNLIGVVFGGLLFEGPAAERWRGFGAALEGQLAEQIGADGAHIERSPMYHSLILENLLDLLNLARATGPVGLGLAKSLESTTGAMLAALSAMTHPDDQIALIGDSAHGMAHPPAALRAYADALEVSALPRGRAGEGILDAVGLVRLAAGPFSLIASTAGVMPAYQPGHAHCDALSFELSIGNQRVVTDTGVAEYIPGALRDVSRATASHATLEIDGMDQAELWSAHRVGGRPTVRLESVVPGHPSSSPRYPSPSPTLPAPRLEASCRGWAKGAPLHRRSFELTEGGMVIQDRLEGGPRAVRLTLPLAPGLEPELSASGGRIRLDSGRVLRIDLPQDSGLSWRTERGPYFPQFGRCVERMCWVGLSPRFTEGSWRFQVFEGH